MSKIIEKYLEKFNLNKDLIKNTFEKNKNVFASEKKFEKNQVYADTIIFVNLKDTLPSRFFLEIICQNTSNKIILNSRKQAIDFTFGKDFPANKFKQNFEEDKYYLVLFEDMILGFVEKKGNLLRNVFNIGKYLKEN